MPRSFNITPGDTPGNGVNSGGSSSAIASPSISTAGVVTAGSGSTPTAQLSQTSQPVASSPPPSATSGHTGSMNTGQDLASMYSNASASIGGCTGLAVADGWEGVASTTVWFHPYIFGVENFVKTKTLLSTMDIWALRVCVALATSDKHRGRPTQANPSVSVKEFTQELSIKSFLVDR